MIQDHRDFGDFVNETLEALHTCFADTERRGGNFNDNWLEVDLILSRLGSVLEDLENRVQQLEIGRPAESS